MFITIPSSIAIPPSVLSGLKFGAAWYEIPPNDIVLTAKAIGHGDLVGGMSLERLWGISLNDINRRFSAAPGAPQIHVPNGKAAATPPAPISEEQTFSEPSIDADNQPADVVVPTEYGRTIMEPDSDPLPSDDIRSEGPGEAPLRALNSDVPAGATGNDAESTNWKDAVRSDHTWMVVVDHLRKTGEWNGKNGPQPGNPGCLVPPHLLRAHDAKIKPGAATWANSDHDVPIEIIDEAPLVGRGGLLYQRVRNEYGEGFVPLDQIRPQEQPEEWEEWPQEKPPQDGQPGTIYTETARSEEPQTDTSTHKLRPEIVVFTKDGGPLTKRIHLNEAGGIVSDGSACVMTRGTAHRAPVESIGQLGTLIPSLKSNQAIALGALQAGLLPEVPIITTRSALNGSSLPGAITRTTQNIVYRPGQPGFALLDHDTKGMPPDVRERLDRAGGFVKALLSVLPGLASTARLERVSTSAGLYRQDTGAAVPGSSGLHVYIAMKDAADSKRFLETLHERCWLAGYGWMMVGAGGQMLERSIVDRMVGSPERLVFEGAPILVPPLAQSAEARRPVIREGDWLDTVVECSPLTVKEKSEFDQLRAKVKQGLSGEAAKARDEFVEDHAAKVVKRTGKPHRVAVEIVRRQCEGVLLPDIELLFDDRVFAGKTVAHVLADPVRYEGETLADPLEGVAYGRCKARIMRRADGTVWIHSFAHGRTVYEIKLDAAAIRAALSKADKGEAVAVLIDMLLRADVDPADEEDLVRHASECAGIGMRAIIRTIKQVRQDKAAKEKQEERTRRLAERDDPRPMVPAPWPDAPWLPVMDNINSVLSASKDRIPPARNLEGIAACTRQKPVPGMHAFVSANEDSDTAEEASPQWMIHAMSDAETAELIERYIDYYEESESSGTRSVHLAAPFVQHYRLRPDRALPFMAAVATLPIVSADGHLIHTDGLDRKRGIVFNVDPALMRALPGSGGPSAFGHSTFDKYAVGEAMRFLLRDWLADVATDDAGKCIIIALALTIIERSLLDQRPAFWVTSGQRGSGKTTTLQMVLTAVTGAEVSAAAWSPNEEERRKALFSYLMTGVPYILWDNIPRGAQIHCPHIERSCTTAWYDDRKLSVSEIVRAAAATIQCFTGNNVGPKGDLASRSLQARLDVDRVDPENRPFKHPDPIGWTRAHRAEILRALYAVALGNPALKEARDAPMKTRFKMWQRLVGSAVEHAARCEAETDPDRDEVPDQVLDFSALFVDQEGEDEDATSLGEMLEALTHAAADYAYAVGRQSKDLKASDVVYMLNKMTANENAQTVRTFLFPDKSSGEQVNARGVTRQLKKYVGAPVRHDKKIIVLRAIMDRHDEVLKFEVVELKA